MPELRTEEVVEFMHGFIGRTGLEPEGPQRRYLWTDAFAVCNLLGLARITADDRHLDWALRLVDRVHHTLGRHRDDDSRSGWLSGLGAQAGEAHPTLGGLRIGKDLPERSALEPFDERLEWDRDGQYFHYLTRWMHALDQVSRSTDDPRYNTWARELAATAYRAFAHRPASRRGRPGIHWKMSIDLTRPLVTAMGQHDPVDGCVTAMQLRATAANLEQPVSGPDLRTPMQAFAAMIDHTELASPDPLGIGGLLADAWRLDQLARQGGPSDERLFEALVNAAARGLRACQADGECTGPAAHRLAFRELGLAIGLQAVRKIWEASDGRPQYAGHGRHAQIEGLLRYVALGTEIESFWRDPGNRQTASWLEHRDINEVMLATALVPAGYLDLVSFQ